VGEIRDKETAQIAIHAALTGHLVLSTLHTNDACGALPRFIDMGVEPFLLASTVNLVIAQRLVRRICKNCIGEYTPDQQSQIFFKEKFGEKFLTQKFYKGKGCEECGNSGYKGRIGIFEVLLVSEAVRQLILTKSSSDDIRKQALKEKMILMVEDGLNKVASGLTTVEEILRVAEE
jgi:type II secretory ATPase GspE/PulE/Tfp pilus assembly ATPase PilB-like protein